MISNLKTLDNMIDTLSVDDKHGVERDAMLMSSMHMSLTPLSDIIESAKEKQIWLFSELGLPREKVMNMLLISYKAHWYLTHAKSRLSLESTIILSNWCQQNNRLDLPPKLWHHTAAQTRGWRVSLDKDVIVPHPRKLLKCFNKDKLMELGATERLSNYVASPANVDALLLAIFRYYEEHLFMPSIIDYNKLDFNEFATILHTSFARQAGWKV